ncbi:hypothetical protein GNI_094040 [Gregarina niphandrodes]|uniref:Uncharacterized protein n=1 Tax=Gregarina niphandrodes TaxID=110365 RepID=A0A023B577_GRENI|nr:hypothetical protein GNI_094040 [Gregarina niphandrodes]EZG58711.1 hypothetical protein GNI_094040 [Gregarina niphandrodes]|eukprot:XP_011130946.1 hypothetical protein GNI_094040 [Gregarina niphandrodes]
MDAEGIRPPVDDCVVRLLTLSDRSKDADIECVVLLPKKAVASLTSKKVSEEACLKRFHWLEICSRFVVYGSPDPFNILGETLVIRELKEYLETVDPEDNFRNVSDEICLESVGRTVAELQKLCEFDNDPLQVTACRRLNFEELEDLLESVPEDWVPALQRSALQCGIFDVESGWSCRSTRCVPNKMCVTVSTGATILSGIAIWALYNWLKPRNSEATTHPINGIFNMSRTTSVNETATTLTPYETFSINHTATKSDTMNSLLGLTQEPSSLLTQEPSSLLTQMSISTPSDQDRHSSIDTFTSLTSSVAADMTKETTKVLRNGTDSGFSVNDPDPVQHWNYPPRGALNLATPVVHNDTTTELVTGAVKVRTNATTPVVHNDTTTGLVTGAVKVRTNAATPVVHNDTTTGLVTGAITTTPNATPSGVRYDTTTELASGKTPPVYTSPFKTRMSREALDRIQLPRSDCNGLFNAKSFMKDNWAQMGEPGMQYPCEGGSGILLCGAHEEIQYTCHVFGAPWMCDAFGVRDAVGVYLKDNGNCVVRCDSEEEMGRNLWKGAYRNLLYVPSNVLNRRSDFDAILPRLHPLDKKCSGSCEGDGCERDNFSFIRDCRCAISKVKCLIKPEEYKSAQPIESFAYHTDTRDVFRNLSAFNAKKKGQYEVRECKYECLGRELGVEETEDTSRFKTRITSGELNRLALTRYECRKIFRKTNSTYESIIPSGRYPCEGYSGIMKCGEQESCHHFGGPWTFDAFAVQHAIRYHQKNDKGCIASCPNMMDRVRDLWQETDENLPYFTEGNVGPQLGVFEDFLSQLYPVNDDCSFTCTNCDRKDFADVKQCLCALANVSCRVRPKGEKFWQRLESVGYHTNPVDILRSLTVFNTKEKEYDVDNCQYKCHLRPLKRRRHL